MQRTSNRPALLVCALAFFAAEGGAVPEKVRSSFPGQEPVLPRPKSTEVAGSPFALETSGGSRALIVALDPSPQAAAGVEVLNRRVENCGGTALEVVASRPEGASSVFRIMVATRGAGEVDEAAIRDFNVSQALPAPGSQGYVIEWRGEGAGREVLVAGADALGTLYGCVTLAHDIGAGGGGVTVSPNRVRDWPDFLYRCSAEPGEARQRYRRYDERVVAKSPDAEAAGQAFDAYFQRLIDWLVWNKINRLSPFIPERRTLGQAERLDRWTRYMEDRGVSFTWCASPYVGLAAENRRGCVKFGNTEFCWSDDAAHRRYAERAARTIRLLRVKHFMLHMIDQDGPDPESWSRRCAACRGMFDDDRAAADCHVFRIYWDLIRAENPDCRMEFVPVPYKAWPFADAGAVELSEEWQSGAPVSAEKRRMARAARDYFARVNALLPQDACVALREHGRTPSLAYKRAFGNRALTIWYWQFPARGWQTLFHNRGRYTKTWRFGDPRDMIFATSSDLPATFRLINLFNHEYAWNADGPGAAVLEPACDFRTGSALLEPEGVTSAFLAAACRQLYGPEAGPVVAELAKLDLSFLFVARPRTARVIHGESHPLFPDEAVRFADLPNLMRSQAEAAGQAVSLCGRLFDGAPTLDGEAASRLPSLYRSAVAAKWVAGAWSAKWDSERELLVGRPEAAAQRAEEGLCLLAARGAERQAVEARLAPYGPCSVDPGSVEHDLTLFDGRAVEACLHRVAACAAAPQRALAPSLPVIGPARAADGVEPLQLFRLPLERTPMLMAYPPAVLGRRRPEGLELTFRVRHDGAAPGVPPSRGRDTLLARDAAGQGAYMGIYARDRATPRDVRVFLFDAAGNRLDGTCRSNLTQVVDARWDARWRYRVVERPGFLAGMDLTPDPEWRVSVARTEGAETTTVLLPWASLPGPGHADPSAQALPTLEFVFESYWRSCEPFQPSEYGVAGVFDGRWIPVQTME